MSVGQVTAKHVILTGPPGIGKTTLVQKICQVLKEKGIPHTGFLTQEIRENGTRTGFEIITTDGQRGTLSSINSTSKRRVGQYGVEVEQFETLALPLFSRLVRAGQESSSDVLVIDEVGKMELFSDRFKQCVNQAFKAPSVRIVVTIPIKKGKEIPFVEEIRNRPDGKLFMVRYGLQQLFGKANKSAEC